MNPDFEHPRIYSDSQSFPSQGDTGQARRQTAPREQTFPHGRRLRLHGLRSAVEHAAGHGLAQGSLSRQPVGGAEGRQDDRS